MTHTLRIEGYGQVNVQPDYMRLVYELRHDAPSYADAYAQLIAHYDFLVKAFRTAGFNVALIKTRRVDVTILEETKDEPRQYRCTQTVVYEDMIDLNRMSVLLDVLRDQDDFNFNLSYYLSDASRAQQDALILAINDATDKAKVIAEASGVRLGSICDMNYGDGVMPRTFAASARMGGMVAEDLSIEQRITVTWEIK